MSLPIRPAISLPIPPDVAACLEKAVWAEQCGYDGVWLADVGTVDALTLAAAIGACTHSLRIGIGVTPVYTRTAAVLASTATTLSHLAPGRFVMGLGASSHTMVENWNGIPFEKPVTRVRETAQLLRKMLAGEKSDFQGATLRSKAFRVSPLPKGAVPIYLAGLRPKMLEMAGEYGDGIVLNSYPLQALPRMLEHVAIGAARAGKKLEELEIVCRHHVIVTDDAAAGREDFRRRFAGYFATEVYNRFLAWAGLQETAATIAEGWVEKDRAKTAGALTDDVVDKLAVIGDAEHCRAVIREHIEAGITTPCINPITSDPAVVQATFEAFSPARFAV